jgi:hypothetical protein
MRTAALSQIQQPAGQLLSSGGRGAGFLSDSGEVVRDPASIRLELGRMCVPAGTVDKAVLRVDSDHPMDSDALRKLRKRMGLMKPAGIAPAVLLMASVASAHPMVPIKDVSSHTGKWKGSGGP